MKTTALVEFIKARHDVYLQRSAGRSKPWTTDPILLDYKFCNMYRELDTGTRWISNNWRTPHAADPDLWFAMVVARLLNRPSTLATLGYPLPWKPAKFIDLVHSLKAAKLPAFSGAYMISTHGRKMDKAAFLANEVLTPLWKARKHVRPRDGDTLASFNARLVHYHGMGSFLGAQVVADIKYVVPLLNASDWWTWAASGPGSRRGLNRVLERPVSKAWREETWHGALAEVQTVVAPMLAQLPGYPRMHAQDLQNCLCEFDKYERVRLNEGRTRSKYNGRE